MTEIISNNKAPLSLAVAAGTAAAVIMATTGPIGWTLAGSIALNAVRNGVITWGALDISDKLMSGFSSKWEARKVNKTKLSSVPTGVKA